MRIMFTLPSVDMQETFQAGVQWFWLPLHKDKSQKLLLVFVLFFKYKFIYFNGRLITLQYCIGFAIH